jgi:alpha,alpha-trehalase
MTELSSARDREAAEIIRGNDRGGYTVPTKGLYPFQWNWDSCLVALGWARFDEDRAWTEIETLLGAQWPDGMVPHIVFHKPDPGYFPGPERWGTGRTPPTSGITQPPVAASCVRRILEGAKDAAMAERRARALLPKLLAYHRWFHGVRDPDAEGIVSVLHPWETGMDNSPAWDEALARVEVAPDLEPYTRRDTQHVDASMRPTKAEYDRYMTLVALFRARGWRHEITRASPFRVADVGVNCILMRADRDLLALARRLADAAAAAEIEGWIERAERGFERFVEPATGMWHSIDQVAGRRGPAATHAGFLAFWAGCGDARLLAQLESWMAKSRYAVASVAPGDPRFDAVRYWRGPIWAVVNFMIAEGLGEAGRADLAERIRGDTRELIDRTGFYEYFSPVDGRGCGGGSFTWTAAMWLAWAGRTRS